MSLSLSLAVDAVTPGITEVVLDATIIRVSSVTWVTVLADLDWALAPRGVRLEVTGLTGDPLAMARRTSWWQGLEREGADAGLGGAGRRAAFVIPDDPGRTLPAPRYRGGTAPARAHPS